jgi:diacylglycerol kinase family enzyme
LLVANPTARSGKAKRYIDDAMAVLDDAGLWPEFFATLPHGETVAALATRIEREDAARVVYMGGDGTFAEAAKAIILARERTGIDVPLGMLPMGTANDQGRSFGITSGVRALRRNVEIIAGGVEQWLDTGRIEAFDADGNTIAKDLWFDSCGVGLSARVLAKRNREREWVEKVPLLRSFYRDKLVYTSATLRTLLLGALGGANFDAHVGVDGVWSQFDSVTDILIQGTIIYAGDWIFAPDAKPDDGKFELVVLRGHADWAAAAIGGHKRNPVTSDDLEVIGLPRRSVPRGRVIEIRLAGPPPGHGDSSDAHAVADVPAGDRPAAARHKRGRLARSLGAPVIDAQIDGEEFVRASSYRIENLFHHLRIIVPEDSHWV